MKRTIALGIVSLLLAGCGGDKKPNVPNMNTSITSIFTNYETGQKYVEKFTDLGGDGSVDFYIIGPADPTEATMINASPEVRNKVKGFVSANMYREFKSNNPGEEMGIRSSSENRNAIMLGGFAAQPMDAVFQTEIDTRYASITSGPRMYQYETKTED